MKFSTDFGWFGQDPLKNGLVLHKTRAKFMGKGGIRMSLSRTQIGQKERSRRHRVALTEAHGDFKKPKFLEAPAIVATCCSTMP